MQRRRVWTVDAFSEVALRGNPAAVVLDGEGLDPAQMQALTAEFNLSETVFLLAASDPAADYRVRIFTPKAELPFAGHPTVAAAYTVHESRWLGRESEGGVLRQECGIGVVPVEIRAGSPTEYVMTQAAPVHRATPLDSAQLAVLLGCAEEAIAAHPIEVVSTGAPWCVAGIRSLAALEQLTPQLPEIAEWSRKLECEGITVYAEREAGSAFRVRLRTFAPRHGIDEDPVCGSGNGAVAAYLARHDAGFQLPFAYAAEQGVEMGRAGRATIECAVEGGVPSIRVGGPAVRVIEGHFTL